MVSTTKGKTNPKENGKKPPAKAQPDQKEAKAPSQAKREKPVPAQAVHEEKERHFWADSIAKALVEQSPDAKQVVSDAKTPSGEIHVGALRGVVLHDIAFKALVDAGARAEFVYRYDDFDPMDSFPSYLPESFQKYMGVPLCDIPSPKPGYLNYAQCYASEFTQAFAKLGCAPRIVWGSEDYRSGRMNDLIRTALEKSDLIREVNVKISGAKKTGNWLPIHVLCEKCGKIGTTYATDFDGKTVAYECNGSNYAKGCGHKGRRSPFDGGSKLTWKVQWAAQFKLYGVTLEGAGKDHYTVGGSREVAAEMCKQVFDYPVPYDMPYEFFLVGGKKMSSSKGIGSTAADVAGMMSPEILRFIMVRYKPKTAINFSPDGDTIPKLYDDYDGFAETYFGRKESRDPDEPRIFALSQVTEEERARPVDRWRPSFSLVAYLIQAPHVNMETAMARAKGSELTKIELDDLHERERIARKWLEEFAGPEDKLSILPHNEGVRKFSELAPGQQKALAEFAEFISTNSNLDKQSTAAREIATRHGITVKDFFQGAYTVLVGKDRGPRLLPFLAALDKQFVVQRLKGVQ